MTFRLAASCAFAILFSLTLRAGDSFVSLEGYPIATPLFPNYIQFEQTLPVENGRVGMVLYPAPGAPALVTRDDSELTVFAACEGTALDHIEIGKDIGGTFTPFLSITPQSYLPAGNNVTRFFFNVPYLLPHGVYDLHAVINGLPVTVSNGVGFIPQKRIAFTIWADPQIEDLQSKKNINLNWNNHEYPGFSDGLLDYSRQQGIIAIAIAQMSAMDTDFIACLGDLVFGINHQREYEDIVQFLDRAEIPFFGVPGNHDGYAKFENENDFSTPLERDGLNYWRAFIGPTYSSSKIFGKTLMMLNTYDGTPERRASGDPIGIGDNGAAPVSNYGGFLSDPQLLWATESIGVGEVAMMFSHQLPIGMVESGFEFTAMEKYPANRIIGAFVDEEWNIETTAYDSNILDTIFAESGTYNTGTRLLGAMLPEFPRPPIYFAGHAHRDRYYHFDAGTEVIPGTGLFAPQEIIFTQTKSAASSGEAYWGIRPIYHDIETATTSFSYLCADDAECNPDKEGEKAGFPSMPLGNFWVNYTASETTSLYIGGNGVSVTAQAEIVNFLPTAQTARLRFVMPAKELGYLFDSEVPVIDDAMLSADRKTMLITAKGEVAAGSTVEGFLQRQFTKNTALAILGPDTVAAPDPEVEYEEWIPGNSPLEFTVTNADDYFHLIWYRDGKPVRDGAEFKEKFNPYHTKEAIELLYIAKNGAFGVKKFSVDVEEETPDDDLISDEDSLIAEEEPVVDDTSAVIPDTAQPDTLVETDEDAIVKHGSDGCGCSVVF
ncbi:MAG TPA: metallophosphoesterase family protein [bacterium]|nr:metallophosphoesterase family protein [bacterium]